MAVTDRPIMLDAPFEVLDSLAQTKRVQSAEELGGDHELLASLQDAGLIERLPRDEDSRLFRLTTLGHGVWQVEHHKTP